MEPFSLIFFILSVSFSCIVGHIFFPLIKGKLHINQDITGTFTNYFNWDKELEPRFIKNKYNARIVAILIIFASSLLVYKFYEHNNLIINAQISNIISIASGLLLGILLFNSNKRKFE
jgi:hypothetical protein